MRKRIRPSTYSTLDRVWVAYANTLGDRTDNIYTATYPVDIIAIRAKMVTTIQPGDAGDDFYGTWGIVVAPDGITPSALNAGNAAGQVIYEPQSHFLGGDVWYQVDTASTVDYTSVMGMKGTMNYEPKEGDSVVGLNVGDSIYVCTGDNGSVGDIKGLIEIVLSN